MLYFADYASPLGGMMVACDDLGLTEVRFTDAPEIRSSASPRHSLLIRAFRWLDIYFSGREPDFTPPLHLVGSAFRNAVGGLMLEIPYGRTVTYGDIARRIAGERGIAHMSAQAVGGAVGGNPLAVIVPCHRVVGARGNLTGYGGGMERKIALLRLEGVDMSGFFSPKR